MDVQNARPRIFVAYSTKASVESGTQSLLAWVEVLVAASVYWIAAIYYYHSVAVLFASACVSLILLLRSDQSVRYGVELFEQYVDSVAWERDPSTKINYFSKRFIFSIAIGTIANAGGVLVFTYLLSFFGQSMHPILKGMAISYFSIIIALAMVTALAATELIVVAEDWKAAILVSLCIITAGTVAALFSRVDLVTLIGMSIVTLSLVFVGFWSGPLVLTRGRNIARQHGKQSVTAMAALQALLEGAPKACLVLTVAVFLGGWLRSIFTRMFATICFFQDGVRSFPSNWRRTLFVQDALNVPEIIPDYRRDDIVNTSYTAAYIWRTPPSDRYVYCFYFLVLIIPAYAYRLCIKSTFWAYWPLLYISKEYKYEKMPRLIIDYVNNSPLERFARSFSAATIVGMLYFTLYGHGMEFFSSVLAIKAISPLEYLLLIDLTRIKPWQYFSVSGSIVTFAIFYIAHKIAIPMRYLDEYPALEREISLYCTSVCKLMQLRNCLSVAFTVIVIAHAALNVTIIQERLSPALLEWARWFYGGALP